MGVVTTETIYVCERKFKKVIRVLSDGKFRIKYPQEIIDALHKYEAVGDTLKEAEEAFSTHVAKYRDTVTTSRKVIIYKINDDIRFSYGMAISVAARVYIEQKVTSGGEEHYNYDRVSRADDLPVGLRANLSPGYGSKSRQCLDWTEDRHQFFVKIHDAMKTLADALSDLNNDQELLLQMADNRMGLLGET